MRPHTYIDVWLLFLIAATDILDKDKRLITKEHQQGCSNLTIQNHFLRCIHALNYTKFHQTIGEIMTTFYNHNKIHIIL